MNFCIDSKLIDPTYQEVLKFVESDQTDKKWYGTGYTCDDFAKNFKNNAMKAGYKCGYVILLFPKNSHALNCFNTTDCGLVFIEPQEDQIVQLSIGTSYWDRKYTLPKYNDTIIGFLINW
jgi:hypothetical protein